MESDCSNASSKATLLVVPKQATLGLVHELSATIPRSLNMKCILERGEGVYTQSGQSLTDSDWTAYVVDADSYNDNATQNGAVGLLVFLAGQGESDKCSISFSLRSELFNTLVATLQGGSQPASMAIEVQGLSWALPPKKGIEWNVDSNRVCPISSVRLNVPLASQPRSVEIPEVEGRIIGRLARLESRVVWFGIFTLISLGLMQLFR